MLYLVATVSTGLAWDLPSFAVLRFLTGAGIGGVLAPWFFGLLIETGSRDQVLIGYLFAATLMLLAALLAAKLGLKSERQPLESVARPLSWHED